MKAVTLFATMLLCLCACARLPEIKPADITHSMAGSAACGSVFPSETWQFVHYIEASLPGGNKGFIMGITVISPTTGTVDCVMMTLEGFVLFDASYDGRLTITRAVPPFNRKGFAEGLMSDIRFIFFAPPGRFMRSGLLDDGSRVCRYKIPDESTIDIVLFSETTWEIRQYSKTNQLKRTVKAGFFQKSQEEATFLPPERLTLKSHHVLGYELSMKLVSASALSQEDQ